MTADQIKSMSTEEIKAELQRCKDPWYYMANYAYTLDTQENRKRKFPADYDFLYDLTRLLENEQFLVILKSRQMFVTWLVVIYSLWEAIMNYGILNIFVSWRQGEVQEMIARAKYVYDNNPPFLKPALGTETKKELEFKFLKSRLVALPSVGKGSTRTHSATRIIMDEAAFIKGAEDFYRGARPSLGDKGKFVILSSSNGSGNLLARIWNSTELEY